MGHFEASNKGIVMSPSIVVVGSLNIDLVVFVERLPRPGETLAAREFKTLPGGKGANQACAVGKLGGLCQMVGAVGCDAFGDELLTSLESAGVDTANVARLAEHSTGTAVIHVATSGENHIVVVSGANAELHADMVERALAATSASFLLLQLETPLPTVAQAAKLAKSRGIKVLLDPAPAQPLPDELLSLVDILTPNETEASALVGRTTPLDTLDDVEQVARQLRDRGVSQVVVKLGSRGAWVQDDIGGRHHAAPEVMPVDTTAAGDTFNGALAVALAEGKSLDEAILWANRAAALSVTREGAQISQPTRQEVEAAD